MHVALADALGQVSLEAGRIYHCQVGKLSVEVRVKACPPAPLVRADEMLDPWIDLPAPRPLTVVRASAAPPLIPDAPQMPEP